MEKKQKEESVFDRIGKIFKSQMGKAMDLVEANLLALEAGCPELMNQGFTVDEMKEILKEEE